MIVIDGVRYRREDAEARGLVEVPEPIKIDSIDPEKLAAFEAWVEAGSPAAVPLDNDRHSSLDGQKVVAGEAEVVAQGEVTLPTADGPVPPAAGAAAAPAKTAETPEKPANDPAPLSSETAGKPAARRSK